MRRLAGVIGAGLLSAALLGVALPASASPELLPIPLPVIPTVTITLPVLPQPVKTVRLPGSTRTITGPPVYIYSTRTVTQTVPGPVQTVRVPQPVSTVTIVRPGPTVTQTLPAQTVTVTAIRQTTHDSVKIVTSAPRNHTSYIRVSIPRAVGISVALVLLGAFLAILALYIVYRVGQKEGWKAGERKGLLDAKRILERR